MATIPKVKVTFDADLDGLKRGTAAAENELTGFGKSVEKFGAMAKAAFAAAAAAAAAYAVKLGVDGVKAAIEDEAAQARLAKTLENAAGATADAVKQTEAFISKMQMATGVSDTTLRAAMGRLTLSTNDVTKSQELLQLALDISAGTGKSVESVANALGKAYDGQTTALGKLGVGLSSTELKGKSFTEVQARLSDLFGGAAARNADTFQGKIAIMQQRFAEFQESVGNKIIPILLSLFNMIDTKVVPAFTWLKEHAIDPVIDAIMRNKDAFKAFGDIIGTYVVPVLTGAFAGALVVVGKVASGVIDIIGKVAGGIATVVNGAIGLINKLIEAYNRIPILPNIPTIPTVSSPTISIPKISTNVPSVSVPTITPPSTGGGGGGSTGSTGVVGASSVIASLPKIGTSAANTPGASILPTLPTQTPTVTVNVNAPSIIDEAGFTNSVIQAFNNGTYRGTAGAGMLAGL